MEYLNETLKGKKVKVLTVEDGMEGTVVDVYLLYPEAGSLNKYYMYQVAKVRLKNGFFLKEVHPHELELLEDNK